MTRCLFFGLCIVTGISCGWHAVSGFSTPTTVPSKMRGLMPSTKPHRSNSRTLPLRFAPHDDNVNDSTSTSKKANDAIEGINMALEEMKSESLQFSSSRGNAKLPTITTDPYIEVATENYFDGTRPDSSWKLALNNFQRQGLSLLQQGLEEIGLKESDPLRPPGCLNLKLSNEAVTEAEVRREAVCGAVEAHPVSRGLYDLGCLILDTLFDGRPIQRFWFLETIARIPYFSYVSMLHLYESFGWFRAVELRKVHAAEDWNELHHLLIMESLGGNSKWSDRFLGYHVAFAYYWFLIAVYLGSPRIAYQFMELLEAHAVDTYTTFVKENRETLRKLPPPEVASSYYKTGDLYLFDDFMTTRKPGTRRPPCETLLDVFENIAIDEGEHVRTMQACQDYAQFGNKVVSSHLKYGTGPLGEIDGQPAVIDRPIVEKDKRQLWKEWSEMINEETELNELDGIEGGSELSGF